MSESQQDVHIVLPARLNDELESHLNYGDSKSEWIRVAIRQRLNDN